MSHDATQKNVKTIAVASGKRGAGKTIITANLAMALRKLGRNVMILDADLGLSNIEVLLHLAPKHNIEHLLAGGMDLKDIVAEGPHGVKILSARSGVRELAALGEFQRLKILEAFDAYRGDIDVLLIDTAAGLSENMAFFCIAAQEIVVVTTPEAGAITDAYALIKALNTRYQEKEFLVLVNAARSGAEAFEVFKRLSLAEEKFLNISLDYLGWLPYDEAVPAAVRAQKPFLDLYPRSKISRKISEIAQTLLERSDKVKGTLQFFIGNVLSSAADAAKYEITV